MKGKHKRTISRYAHCTDWALLANRYFCLFWKKKDIPPLRFTNEQRIPRRRRRCQTSDISPPPRSARPHWQLIGHLNTTKKSKFLIYFFFIKIKNFNFIGIRLICILASRWTLTTRTTLQVVNVNRFICIDLSGQLETNLPINVFQGEALIKQISFKLNVSASSFGVLTFGQK